MITRFFFLCVYLWGLSSFSLKLIARNTDDKNSPFAIVQWAVERDKELLRRRAAYMCEAVSIREKLDRNGNMLKREEAATIIGAANSPDYGTRNEVGDRKGLEQEVKRASQEEPFNIMNVIDRYHYAIAGEEMIHGVPCYKLEFKPKGKQPYRNREEKVANELSGYFWVAKGDGTLMKNTGRLTRPVSVAWIFATLRDLEFLFETQRLPNGDFGPARIEYRFRVSVPFGQIHERHTRVLKNYRRVP